MRFCVTDIKRKPLIHCVIVNVTNYSGMNAAVREDLNDKENIGFFLLRPLVLAEAGRSLWVA